MNMLNDLIGALDQPEKLIDKVVFGPSLVAVLAGDRLGLASHLGAEPCDDEKHLPQEMVGMSCAQAAGLILKDRAYEVSLGVAALNAGLLPQVEGEPVAIHELVSRLGQDAEVALVGQFPFTGWLKENVGKLHLFELKPVEGSLPRDEWEEVLARVKVAAITSTVFLTRHASFYLQNARQAVRIMIGPSTPLCPRLFDYGADILAGSTAPDPERVLPQVRRGGCFSEVVKAGGIEFVQLRRPGLELT